MNSIPAILLLFVVEFEITIQRVIVVSHSSTDLIHVVIQCEYFIFNETRLGPNFYLHIHGLFIICGAFMTFIEEKTQIQTPIR